MADVIRQLFVEFGTLGEDILVRGLTNVKKGLDQQSAAAGKLRTSYLFLAFGLLAAGGLMNRLGRQLDMLSDRFREAFLEVESRAAVVSTVLTGTLEILGEVTDEIFKLATEFGAGLDEIGQLMRDLAAAGFTLEQTFAGAAAALKLARIANLEGADAVRILVGSFFALGFQAEDTAEANQVLAGIVSELADAERLSAVEAGELGESLKFVGATAELVGLELEEILAVLVIAGNQMIRAGIAGRALRVSLLRLAKITGQLSGQTTNAQKIIKQFNLELVDEQGEIIGLADLVDELNTKLGDLTGTQKVAILSTLFGTRATALWSAVINTGAERVRFLELRLKAAAVKEALFIQFGRDMTETIIAWRNEIQDGETAFDFFTKSLGLAPDIAKRLNDVITDSTVTVEDWEKAVREAAIASEIVQERLRTLTGTLDLLNSSVQVMFASFGEALAPVMTQIARITKILADIFTQFPQPLKVVIGLAILGAAVFFTYGGSVLQVFGSIVLLIAASVTLSQVQKTTITTTQLLIIGMKQLAVSTFIAAKKVTLLAFSFLRLVLAAAPFILIFLLADHVFRKVNQPLGIFIGLLGVLAIALLIHSKIAVISAAATLIWAGALDIAAFAGRGLIVAIRGIFAALGPIGIALLIIGVIIALVAAHWDEIVAAVTGFVDFVKPHLMPILNAMMVAMQILAIAGQFLWQNVLVPIGNFLMGTFGAAIQFIMGLFQGWIDMVQFLIDAFTGLADFFAGLFGFSLIPDMIKRGVRESQGFLDELRQAAQVTADVATQPITGVPGAASAGAAAAGGGPEVNISVTIANPVVTSQQQVGELADVVKLAVKKALDEWDSAFDREKPKPVPTA